MILYIIEIIKILPIWINLHEISENQLNQFLWICIQFIQFLLLSSNGIELCFQIIDFTINEMKCKLINQSIVNIFNSNIFLFLYFYNKL